MIVTRSFDLLQNPEILCLFIWRYSQATNSRRGYDTTILKASHDEEMKFKEVVTEHIKQQLSVSDEGAREFVQEHYEADEVFKILIHPVCPLEVEALRQDSGPDRPDEPKPVSYAWDKLWNEEREIFGDGGKQIPPDHSDALDSSEVKTKSWKMPTHDKPQSHCHKYADVQYFLVSTPVAMPLTVANRGTRGYWAVKIPDPNLDELDHKIAFLKDTWVDDSPGFEIEGEIMVELVELGVKFVSDIFCQGNVPMIGGKSKSGERRDGLDAGQCVTHRMFSF